MKKSECYDVVIVGGGLTGYTTAILLLKNGFRVAVIDGLPWEWWWKEDMDSPTFFNFSGAILYGLPGFQPLTSLLTGLGLPLTAPAEKGPVLFQSMEPGFQAIMDAHRLNLYPGLDEQLREYAREFPGWERVISGLYRRVRQYDEKFLNRTDLFPPAKVSGGWWKSTVYGRLSVLAGFARAFRRSSALEELKDYGYQGLLMDYLKMLSYGLMRRRLEEMSVVDLFLSMRLVTEPACLNEKGQLGLFWGLKALYRRLGGQSFSQGRLPQIQLKTKKEINLKIYGHGLLRGRWIIFDAPEGEVGHLLGQRRSFKDMAVGIRPMVHLTVRIPARLVPVGLGRHAVMKSGSEELPLILTTSPPRDDEVYLEIITPLIRLLDAEGMSSQTRRIIDNVRRLIRFLPEDLPSLELRRGFLPSLHMVKWWREGLRSMADGGGSVLKVGPFFITGQGDYLGASLNRAFMEGQRLAFWIMGRR